MKKLAYFLSVILTLVGVACNKSNDKESHRQSTVGKYVYYDDTNVIHTNDNCIKLKFGKDEKGHSTYAKQPVDTTDLAYVERVCSLCVDSLSFEKIRCICERNNSRDRDRKWLFNNVSSG